MGRPSIPDDEKRAIRIQVLLNADELAEVQLAAKLAGMPDKPMPWARGVVLKAARRVISKANKG